VLVSVLEARYLVLPVRELAGSSQPMTAAHERQRLAPALYRHSMSGQATPGRTNGALPRVSALTSYVPLAGFLIDFAIRLAIGVDDWKQAALDAGVLWLVGIGGLILGLPHLVRPAPVAARIGWPTTPSNGRWAWALSASPSSV
jgi:hypothetical protein